MGINKETAKKFIERIREQKVPVRKTVTLRVEEIYYRQLMDYLEQANATKEVGEADITISDLFNFWVKDMVKDLKEVAKKTEK